MVNLDCCRKVEYQTLSEYEESRSICVGSWLKALPLTILVEFVMVVAVWQIFKALEGDSSAAIGLSVYIFLFIIGLVFNTITLTVFIISCRQHIRPSTI